MLHLHPSSEPDRRPGLCRGGVAAGEHSPRAAAGRAVRRRAGIGPSMAMRRSPAPGTSRRSQAAPLFDRRSARLVGATAAGLEACSTSARRAASRTAKRARHSSTKSAASLRRSRRDLARLGRPTPSASPGRRPIRPSFHRIAAPVVAEQVRGEDQAVGGDARSAAGDERLRRIDSGLREQAPDLVGGLKRAVLL